MFSSGRPRSLKSLLASAAPAGLMLTVFAVLGPVTTLAADAGAPSLPPRCGPPSEAVHRVLHWNGHVVALTSTLRWGSELPDVGVFVVDVERGAVRPLQLPGLDRVLDVAGSPDGPAWALGVHQGRPRLVAVRDGRPRQVPLPRTLRLSTFGLALAADGDTVAIYDGSHLHWRAAGMWREHPWPYPPARAPRSAGDLRLALRKKTLYVGLDLGEFGGGLYRLRPGAELFEHPCEHDPGGGALPVVELRSGPGGVWVTQGLAHLGTREGRLSRLGPVGCEVLATSDGDAPEYLRHGVDGTAFDGLDFDRAGVAHLLTRDGLLRRSSLGWTSLTPGFRERLDRMTCTVEVGDEVGTVGPSVQGVVLAGDEAVIGTNGFGLLLWNLQTQQVRQVQLLRAEPERP